MKNERTSHLLVIQVMLLLYGKNHAQNMCKNPLGVTENL